MHVVHAPHRWYSLEEKEHGVNQLRVIGGVCGCCLKVGMQFYDVRNNDTTNTIPLTNSTIAIAGPITSDSIDGNNNNHDDNNGNENKTKKKSLGIPMHPVSEAEIAETTKIVENAHRYLQIAFAEELYIYCQANNINFPEVRDALNTKWNVNILEPRNGVGGHCLPKDTKMFLQSSNEMKSKILTAAMDVDQDYRRYRTNLEKQIKSPIVEESATRKSYSRQS
jgi:UDP-N-acetyl-D-mannosaminuronic acid dehydrogenase